MRIQPPYALATALVLTTFACREAADPVASSPVLGTAAASAASIETGDDVVASATGAGQIRYPDGSLRKFTVSAVRTADGTTRGEYDLKLAPVPFFQDVGVSPPILSFHGTITCMTVIGNSAYLGGTVDAHVNGELFFGRDDFTGAAIELIDNGEGPDAAPDQISSVAVYFSGSPSTPQDYCDDPAPGTVMPIEQGNITVR